MRFFYNYYLLCFFFSAIVFAQVEIGADPADSNLESGAAVEKSNRETPSASKTFSYNKEDREKVLVILKKFHPDNIF